MILKLQLQGSCSFSIFVLLNQFSIFKQQNDEHQIATR